MTVGTKGETFFIKQKVAVLTSFKNAVLISIYLSNKRLAIKFKNGNTYSIPISKLSDITITEKQWIKISFFNNENIPEISTHGIDRITFAQVKKNNEGKTIITTSTDWINNWIFNFSNQTENKENNNFSKSPNQLKVSYNSPSSDQKQKIQKSIHTNRHQISFMSTLKFWKENNNNSYRRIMSVFPIIGILFIILLISQQGGIGANTNVNAGESYINSFPEMTDSPTPIITMSINQEKIDKVRTSEETYLKINEFVSTCDESIGEIEKIKSQIADAAHDEDRDKISKLNNEIKQKATISHDKILGLSNEMNINNRELKNSFNQYLHAIDEFFSEISNVGIGDINGPFENGVNYPQSPFVTIGKMATNFYGMNEKLEKVYASLEPLLAINSELEIERRNAEAEDESIITLPPVDTEANRRAYEENKEYYDAEFNAELQAVQAVNNYQVPNLNYYAAII